MPVERAQAGPEVHRLGVRQHTLRVVTHGRGHVGQGQHAPGLLDLPGVPGFQHGVPVHRRHLAGHRRLPDAQVAHRVQPAAQGVPVPDQRLVGDLDRRTAGLALLNRQQPHALGGEGPGDLPQRRAHLGPRGGAFGVVADAGFRDVDEMAGEQAPRRLPPAVVQPLQHRVGPSPEHAVQAAARLQRRIRDDRAVQRLPQFLQGVLQQRQQGRRPGDLADQVAVDAVGEADAEIVGRPAHGLRQFLSGHGRQVHPGVVQQVAGAVQRLDGLRVVGPQRDHHAQRAAGAAPDQTAQEPVERLPLRRVGARHQLLELVQDDEQAAPRLQQPVDVVQGRRPRLRQFARQFGGEIRPLADGLAGVQVIDQRPRQGAERLRSDPAGGDRPSPRRQGRRHARPHHRRFAGPGGADDHHHRLTRQPVQDACREVVPAAEPARGLRVERRQTAVGARQRRPSPFQPRDRDQIGQPVLRLRSRGHHHPDDAIFAERRRPGESLFHEVDVRVGPVRADLQKAVRVRADHLPPFPAPARKPFGKAEGAEGRAGTGGHCGQRRRGDAGRGLRRQGQHRHVVSEGPPPLHRHPRRKRPVGRDQGEVHHNRGAVVRRPVPAYPQGVRNNVGAGQHHPRSGEEAGADHRRVPPDADNRPVMHRARASR